MSKRIYVVSTPAGKRLVRATSPAQAVRHASGSIITAKVAEQDEIAELCGGGMKVENAGETPDQDQGDLPLDNGGAPGGTPI